MTEIKPTLITPCDCECHNPPQAWVECDECKDHHHGTSRDATQKPTSIPAVPIDMALYSKGLTLLLLDSMRDEYNGQQFLPLHWLCKNNHTQSLLIAFTKPDDILSMFAPVKKSDLNINEFQIMWKTGASNRITKPIDGSEWAPFLDIFRDQGKDAVFNWLEGRAHE